MSLTVQSAGAHPLGHDLGKQAVGSSIASVADAVGAEIVAVEGGVEAKGVGGGGQAAVGPIGEEAVIERVCNNRHILHLTCLPSARHKGHSELQLDAAV